MSTRAVEYISTPSPERYRHYHGKIGRYMSLAARVATQSDFPDYRHGAVLVKGGSVINTACNKDNFCSFGHRFRTEQDGHATLHAELGAILGLDRSITEGATIYVARIGKAGRFKLSKPCPMCHAAMGYVGIKRVVFSYNGKYCGEYKP
jgi:deoxycytidylate deaminase